MFFFYKTCEKYLVDLYKVQMKPKLIYFSNTDEISQIYKWFMSLEKNYFNESFNSQIIQLQGNIVTALVLWSLSSTLFKIL